MIDEEYFGHKAPPADGQASWNDGLRFLMNQATKDSEKWFPDAQTLPFLALCLAGEVGEVANLLKKVERGSKTLDEVRYILTEEVVDVLIYLVNLMGHEEFKDVNWMDIWYRKRQYNEERFNPVLVAEPDWREVEHE